MTRGYVDWNIEQRHINDVIDGHALVLKNED